MDSDEILGKEEILGIIEPVLRKHFRPEFLNRIDEILPFSPLRQKDMSAIVEIQLQQLKDRMAGQQVALKWQPEAVALLAEEGYDPSFGARPLKRLLQQRVVNMLASALLQNDIRSGHTVTLTRTDNSIGFETEQ